MEESGSERASPSPTRMETKVHQVQRIFDRELLEFLKSKFESGKDHKLSKELFIRELNNDNRIPNVETKTAMEALFDQIDVNHEGFLDWDTFATFVMLDLKENDLACLRQNMLHVVTPAVKYNMHLREMFVRARPFKIRQMVTGTSDGSINFWLPSNNGINHQRCINLSASRGGYNTEQRIKTKWVADFVFCHSIKKLVVASTDRELWFYDNSTFESSFMISEFPTKPLRLETWLENDETFIAIGDDQGTITILGISPSYNHSAFFKRSIRDKFLPLLVFPLSDLRSQSSYYGNIKYSSWNVHADWVTDLKWEPSLCQLISCSDDNSTALVLGEGHREIVQIPESLELLNASNGLQYGARGSNSQRRQIVFTGGTRAVKAFCYSAEHFALISGGIDRLIRVWNPYINSKPTAILRGHSSPIHHLVMVSAAKLASYSTDNVLMLWDIKAQYCIVSLTQNSHHIRDDVEALLFNSAFESLIAISSNINILQIEAETQASPSLEEKSSHSHPGSVRCALVNNAFFQLVTAGEDGLIRVWEISNGSQVFEFKSITETNVILTAAVLDATNTRLCTTSTNGEIKVWNFNVGQLLATFASNHRKEITDIVYVQRKKSRQIVSVGWCRHVHVFRDSVVYDEPHSTLPENDSWDQSKGHKDDIVAVAYSEPALLATASFDGEILLWNSNSGLITGRLIAPVDSSPPPPSVSSSSWASAATRRTEQSSLPIAAAEMLSSAHAILALTFISNRVGLKAVASLISTSSNGRVCFWNTLGYGNLVADFHVSSSVVCIEIIRDFSAVAIGDQEGFITLWDIASYGLDCTSIIKTPPPRLARWQAHLDEITSIREFRSRNAGSSYLVSSSKDWKVRLWSADGGYFGTFGQDTHWDITRQPSSDPPPDVKRAEQRKQSLIKEMTEPPKPRQSASRRMSGVYSFVDNDLTDDALLKEFNRISVDFETTVFSSLQSSQANTVSLSNIAQQGDRLETHESQTRTEAPRFGFGTSRRIQSAPPTRPAASSGARVGVWQRHLNRPMHTTHASITKALPENVFATLPVHELGATQKPIVAKPTPQRKFLEDEKERITVVKERTIAVKTTAPKPLTTGRSQTSLLPAIRPVSATKRN